MYFIRYKDDSLDILMEASEKKLSKSEFNKIVDVYRERGFYGEFFQEKDK